MVRIKTDEKIELEFWSTVAIDQDRISLPSGTKNLKPTTTKFLKS